jgi:hypothetical protein
MEKNKPIRKRTEITGFFVITIKIPKKIDIREMMNINTVLYPVETSSAKIYKYTKKELKLLIGVN